MTRRDKPSKSDFKTFWSVFEAQQQRKKTIPPSNFTENNDQEQNHEN